MKPEPKDILFLYYTALYSGDLHTVKALMTNESYMMTLETFGLRLSLKDAIFKSNLKMIRESKDVLLKVEQELSLELISRKMSPGIEVIATIPNGDYRQTVEYLENGQNKKLYFSKESDGWKINYYAGRKVGL